MGDKLWLTKQTANGGFLAEQLGVLADSLEKKYPDLEWSERMVKARKLMIENGMYDCYKNGYKCSDSLQLG